MLTSLDCEHVRTWLNSRCVLKHAFVFTVFTVCKSPMSENDGYSLLLFFSDIEGGLLSCDNKTF